MSNEISVSSGDGEITIIQGNRFLKKGLSVRDFLVKAKITLKYH